MAPPPGHPSRPLCGHPRPSPLPPHCPHPTEQAFTYTDPSLKPQCSWGLVGPSPPTLRCPQAWRRPPLLPDGGLLSVPRVPLPGFPQGPPRAVCSAWSPGPPSVLMATSADSRETDFVPSFSVLVSHCALPSRIPTAYSLSYFTCALLMLSFGRYLAPPLSAGPYCVAAPVLAAGPALVPGKLCAVGGTACLARHTQHQARSQGAVDIC